MHNLRRFYYQNKEKIWKVVLIIAFLLGIIYFLNHKAIEDNNKNSSTVISSSNVSYSDNENNTYISNKSAISGGSVTKQEVEKINSTISKFLQYCKNEKYEEAYNMLSLDCKEKKYQTLEKFTQNYAKTKFNKNDVYEVEEWINNTYRVSISVDKLATGELGNSKKLTEYITIVEEDSQNKLNINSYVGQKDIGKEVTQDNVKVTVLSKEIYMDYEIYNFKIENLSSETIKLDAFESADSIYLEDSKGYKYNSYKHEILEEKLEMISGMQLEISIKFSNAYTSNRDIKRIIFSNLVLDYKQYKTEPESDLLSEFIINL